MAAYIKQLRFLSRRKELNGALVVGRKTGKEEFYSEELESRIGFYERLNVVNKGVSSVTISRDQFYVIHEGKDYFLTHCSEKVSTYINGALCQNNQKYCLKNRDEIGVSRISNKQKYRYNFKFLLEI